MKALSEYLAAHGVPTNDASLIPNTQNAVLIDGVKRYCHIIVTDSDRILAAMAEQASDDLGWVWKVYKLGAICPVGEWLPAGNVGKDWECYELEDCGRSPVELLALLHGRNLLMKGRNDGNDRG